MVLALVLTGSAVASAATVADVREALRALPAELTVEVTGPPAFMAVFNSPCNWVANCLINDLAWSAGPAGSAISADAIMTRCLIPPES